ncbi:MAG: hypothetical protein FJ118_10050 [Deltaproteobacteria bacterium]|nr:hypothetical protein [Deltaproteobacteria bacterium]
MGGHTDISKLLKRKFDPVSDWRPVGPQAEKGSKLKSAVSDTLEEAHKIKDYVEKAIEPLADDAKARIREASAMLVDVAGKSSKEARKLLAKTLKGLAKKIEP